MRGRILPLGLFLLQLCFNALWSWLFFGRHQPALAFGDILLLWLSLLATIIAFRKVNVVAGWLLAPYLLWVAFAAGLNFALWRLNREPAMNAEAASDKTLFDFPSTTETQPRGRS